MPLPVPKGLKFSFSSSTSHILFSSCKITHLCLSPEPLEGERKMEKATEGALEREREPLVVVSSRLLSETTTETLRSGDLHRVTQTFVFPQSGA